MKLSEMSTEQLAQTLCDLAPPLCRIAQDEAVTQALATFAECGDDGQPLLVTLSRMASLLLPALLKSHAEDVYAVLAILTGKPAAAIRAQPGLITMRDLRACWDGELADFFVSAGIAAPANC